MTAAPQGPRWAERTTVAETGPSLRDGTPITIRPIQQGELDRIVLRCWPDRKTLDRLFTVQGTIGMAAWEGRKCVGQLHCYRVPLPDGENRHWPEWNRWWSKGDRVFGTWGPRKVDLGLAGPGWCHACIHVGRTLASDTTDEPDTRYYGCGIGTSLCKASVFWARQNGYRAVLAPGAADGLVEFARWSGHLPYTTYVKLGFRAHLVPPEDNSQIPEWAAGKIHEPIASEIKNALRTRPPDEILERVMVLDPGHAQPLRPADADKPRG